MINQRKIYTRKDDNGENKENKRFKTNQQKFYPNQNLKEQAVINYLAPFRPETS